MAARCLSINTPPCIGTIGGFDLHAYLEEQSGRSLDRAALETGLQHAMAASSCTRSRCLPGIADVCLVREAARAETGDRVELYAEVGDSQPSEIRAARRSSMLICTSDYVSAVKPDPALYLLALEKLGVQAERGHRVRGFAATAFSRPSAAGFVCIAVPNPLTGDLPLELADRRLGSLAEFDLDDV